MGIFAEFAHVGAISVAIVAGVVPPAPAAATSRYVSAMVPMVGRSVAVGAVRAAGLAPSRAQMTPPGTPGNTWTKLANLPGAVVHDVAFSSATVGYAAAELGQVWKTTNGGKNWTAILNRGFPDYYYGVNAMGNVVSVSGFDDSAGTAILTVSHDGGLHWAADVVLSSNAWGGRVRMTHKVTDGLVMNGEGLGNPNAAWWTTTKKNWAQVTPDANGGWFGYQFTLLKDQTAYASGINYCKSADTGATWSCAPPADQVFDGPTEFVNDTVGWTGGGEIAPDVAGWLHRTTDGGAHWSARVLNSPWPIRQITFLSTKLGWAAGGNIYSNVGGIYFSTDGGKHWTLDTNTGDEVGSCATAKLGAQTQIWCIGDAYENGGFSSNVYSTAVQTP